MPNILDLNAYSDLLGDRLRLYQLGVMCCFSGDFPT